MASTKAETQKVRLLRQLAATLRRLPEPERYCVAFSGGLDSSVLLHTMAALRHNLAGKLVAFHVNHGLSAAASQWAGHCERVCEKLGIEITVQAVDARAGKGASPEAAARDARYAVFADLVQARDYLLTAHHQDDQAETILLQLLRGSGPHGLAAMPFVDRFGAGWHVRPLLDLRRDVLQAYAQAQDLRWIEDPSNFNTGLRRNFLRHDIIPRLKQQWPSLARTVSRSAAHSAAATLLLDGLAATDLDAVSGSLPGSLIVSGLMRLSHERQANALRAWFRRLDLPLPNAVHLGQLRSAILPAKADATPLLAWPGVEIRRYRGLLYAMPPPGPHDPHRVIPWDLKALIALPFGGSLAAHPVAGQGLKTALVGRGDIAIRFRRGGERCRPAGRSHTHALKKLLQESGVAPWLRERVPLIYIGGEIAAVAGVCACEGYQAGPGETGLDLEWSMRV